MGSPARHECDDLIGRRELTWVFCEALLNVTEVIESIDQLTNADRLPGIQLERPSKHPWEHALPFATQPCVDLACEDDIVIADDDDKSG
jgi:hypothetical protein